MPSDPVLIYKIEISPNRRGEGIYLYIVRMRESEAVAIERQIAELVDRGDFFQGSVEEMTSVVIDSDQFRRLFSKVVRGPAGPKDWDPEKGNQR
jgi:hypothetical protein